MTTEFTAALHDSEYRITLGQPDLGNTLTLDAMRALAAEIRKAGRDSAVKIIRIRASGPAFCRGRAVSAPPSTPPTSAQFRRNVADPILDVYRAMHESEVPLLAEVQGDAEGFGCALVTACDMAVASDSARFSLPELQKNLPPTLVLVYGHPNGGTPIMKAHPSAALDLPLRVLVRSDADGHTLVAFHPVVEMLARHGVPEEMAARLRPAQALIGQALQA